jgi:hypothetical protein
MPIRAAPPPGLGLARPRESRETVCAKPPCDCPRSPLEARSLGPAYRRQRNLGPEDVVPASSHSGSGAVVQARARSGGRVVEGARLESVYTVTRIVGSNPTRSATRSKYLRYIGKFPQIPRKSAPFPVTLRCGRSALRRDSAGFPSCSPEAISLHRTRTLGARRSLLPESQRAAPSRRPFQFVSNCSG